MRTGREKGRGNLCEASQTSTADWKGLRRPIEAPEIKQVGPHVERPL